jgi:outer membrane protein TolC
MKSKKDLTVLKKLFILFSLLIGNAWGGEAVLQNYLTDEKNLMFDFQQQQNTVQTGQLQNSWISPVTVSYQRDYKPDARGEMRATDAFTIGIDQPIFKSGGIYYGIKYARALRGANAKEIALQKRQMIAQAVQLLFEYKKTKLQLQKLKLLVRNGAIAIERQTQLYRAGAVDSSTLDQTILAHNRDQAQKLDLELALQQMRTNFRFLSDKNPDKLRLPKLKLLSLNHYAKNNLKLAAQKLRAMEKRYGAKMTWTKYLPTVTAYAHYQYTDSYTPGTMHGYKNYGVRVNMALNINAPADIEAKRLEYLLAQVNVRDQRKIIRAEYALVRASLRILDRKIALAKKDEALYRRLLASTQALAKAGERTDQDVQTMRNSLKIKRIDRRIYYLEKQLQLLKLYAKVAR